MEYNAIIKNEEVINVAFGNPERQYLKEGEKYKPITIGEAMDYSMEIVEKMIK